MSVLGLDIGTTGCKAIAFNDQWTVLGSAAREYAIETPQPGWYEQDAQQVWDLALVCLAEAVSQCRGDHPRALALSVQGEAVIPVDREGRPLRLAILGMDTRTVRENRWLADTFGAETLVQRTGIPMHTMNTLTKLLWLKQHQPKLWAAAESFLLYEDYFLRRLCGVAYISPCLASRTQMFDLQDGRWMEDVLDRCDIDSSRLARLPANEPQPLGSIVPEVAERLGLVGEVQVVSGGHDQACAALGSGVIQPGLAMVSTGTAEVVEVALAAPTLADSLVQGGISVYRHVVPGLFLAMTLNHSGGLSLRWYRDSFCRDRIEQADTEGRDAYDLILAEAGEGPTDLLVLPHFAGAGTPLLDTESRGAILGLSFASTRADVAKAILEGLTFELKINLDLLTEAGISIRELHAVGGGSKSPLWLRLKAGICDLPLRVPDVTEAACLGAAMLAAVGSGMVKDLQTAADQAVRFSERIEPDREVTAAYERRHRLYRDLYPTLSRLNHHLAASGY